MGIAIRKDTVVGLVYDLRDDRDQLLETRTPADPLYYIHGHQQILPAIERAVEGQTPGFRTTLHLQADDAYGRYDRALVAEMRREQFPRGLELKAGMKFQTKGPKGQPLTVRVVDIEKDKVIVDGNHPLAGVPLTFELMVHSARQASAEELETGIPGKPKPSQLH